jgi:hypothetical protein
MGCMRLDKNKGAQRAEIIEVGTFESRDIIFATDRSRLEPP